MKLYFISGLGADKRVFDRMNFEGHESFFIEWISPKKKEILPEYAKRLAAQIDQREDFVIIGVSFGGMIASELSELLAPRATILISSMSHVKALGQFRKIFRHLAPSHKLLNLSLPLFLAIAPFLFGVKEKKDKLFLRKIITETDPTFVAWAVSAILSWNRTKAPENILGIHGTSDLLIPSCLRRDIHKIKGGHFIIWQEAAKIEAIIKSHLQELS